MAKNKRQTFFIIFLIILTFNFIERVVDSISNGQWQPVFGQLLVLLAVGYVVYRSRNTIKKSRNEYRRRFEAAPENVSMKDAALFSLAWSKEIYRSIPHDRKQLVKQAFVLIGIGMGIVLLTVGFDNILTVLVITLLVAAGMNLLVWVFATEREERDHLKVELETARLMQLSLMPTSDPTVPGLDVSGICIPAQNVGGDHFDYVWFDTNKTLFGIAVVDVAGKGMDAAMTAVFTSGAFISEVLHETDIAKIMSELNCAIRSRNNRTRFVSFLVAMIDVQSGVLQFVNAGQSKPMLLRDGQAVLLETHGAHFPLGLVESVSYQKTTVQLRAEDSILFYTDGFSEAMNSDREIFGEERMKMLFSSISNNHVTAKEMVEKLKNEVLTFSLPQEQHDDLTMIYAHIQPTLFGNRDRHE